MSLIPYAESLLCAGGWETHSDKCGQGPTTGAHSLEPVTTSYQGQGHGLGVTHAGL